MKTEFFIHVFTIKYINYLKSLVFFHFVFNENFKLSNIFLFETKRYIRYSHVTCIVYMEKDGEPPKFEEAKKRFLASPCDRSGPRLYEKKKMILSMKF